MAPGDLSRKARLEQKMEAVEEARVAQEEAASWNDDDKKLQAKRARAAERELRADRKVAARHESRALHEAEEEAAERAHARKGTHAGKVTQAEIARRQA
eukprot:CAMPEP_0179248154 /NCGR_PEP_ID=MMETSP0797-20121207/19981_1 /TAXON_ID=47934 /ORGANISM="Dinophysis acuminata, Strain DAEP01" /LENGTH=98 /DNA_ID=CAMNT_0020955801 /DNA_START=68 /DNA_END=360 /DNA_ORIENTATION=+